MKKRKSLKIDKGVPLPKRNIHIDTIKKMKIGDSVFFSNRAEANRFSQAFYQFTHTKANRKLRYQQSMRKIEGGWRVWKVAKETL